MFTHVTHALVHKLNLYNDKCKKIMEYFARNKLTQIYESMVSSFLGFFFGFFFFLIVINSSGQTFIDKPQCNV